MPREHNPRKSSAGKPPPDGFNERGDAMPSVDGESIDLRAGPHRQELGRSPRDASSSANETMSHYKKSQAQKFAEHASKPHEIPRADASLDTVEPNPVLQGSVAALDEPASFGSAKRGRKKPRKTKATDGVVSQVEQPPPNNTPFEISPATSPLVHDDTKPQDAVASAVKEEPLTIKPSIDTPNNTVPADGRDANSIGGSDGGGMKKKPSGGKLKFEDDAKSADGTSSAVKPYSPAQIKSGRKLEKAERKVERSSKKLQTAKEKLPTKRKLRTNKEFDAEKGKMKPRLRFEQEVKTQGEHLRGPAIIRPLKTGANMAIGFAHTKVFQVQEENVGVKAAHKGEMLAEGGLRIAYRHHKLAPYRKVQKLEERTRKLGAKAAYRKALHDNPELRKKPLARLMQKRRIKREYAKAARDAKRAGTKVGATVKKTSNIVQKLTTTLVKVVKSNPKFLALLALAFLMIVIIFGMVSSCASVASSVGQSFAAIVYLADDEDIDEAALLYTYLEADLQLQLINLESDWPNIDEFRLDIGAIGHCPFTLMAYLTAVYHDFTFADVEDAIREIFAQQYKLELVPEVEEC